jgi:Dolichyl-phosphate-mannose-protein mannosyltransferase
MARVRVRPFPVGLLLVLLIGAAARCIGLGFGLPHPYVRPDELNAFQFALRMVGAADPNPHFFHWPSAYLYALAGLSWMLYAGGQVVGWWSSIPDFTSAVDPVRGADVFLLGRGLNAVCGTATVYLTYRLAQSLAGRTAALPAAFFLAIAPLHVRESHFAMTDVPMVMLAVAAMLPLAAALHSSGAVAPMATAGLLAGLSAGTKYQALALIAPAAAVQVAWLLSGDEPGASMRRFLRARAWLPLAVFLAAMSVGFLLATPYAVLDWPRFSRDFAFNLTHLSGGHGVDLGRGWQYHARVSLWYGLGPPVLATGLVGFAILFRQDWRRGLLLTSFPVAVYIALAGSRTVFVRYVLPMLPFLAVGAGHAVSVIGARATGDARARSILRLALTLVIALPATLATVAFDRLISRSDSRVLAAAWVRQHVPSGRSVGQTAEIYGRLWLPEWDGRLGYPQYTYDEPAHRFAHLPGDGWPDVIVLARSPLRQYAPTHAGLDEDVRRRGYTLAHRVVAYDERRRNHYDLQDAFFVPLEGFRGVERPGPNIEIFVR